LINKEISTARLKSAEISCWEDFAGYVEKIFPSLDLLSQKTGKICGSRARSLNFNPKSGFQLNEMRTTSE